MPEPNNGPAVIRIQFDVSQAQMKTMEMIIKMSPSSINSKRELIISALWLYRWALTEQLKGHIIACKTPDNKISDQEFLI